MIEGMPSAKGKSFPVKPGLVIAAIVVIAVIVLLSTSVFMVDATEQAVVLFLGRFSKIAGPGLHFKLPFGIEQNYNVPTEVFQKLDFGFRTEQAGITSRYSADPFTEEKTMLTGDLNIVNVEWIIQYKIFDPMAWLFNVEYTERTIRDISQSVMNQLVGDRTIVSVIGAERENIQVQCKDIMNTILSSYELGIQVTTVRLQDVKPPEGEVQDAYEDVNKAIQDMNRLINEGKEAYNKEIPQSQGEANKIIQQAQGYAAERVNKARGDVARFNAVLAEYRKSPEITKTRLYYEMIDSIFSSTAGVTLIDKTLDSILPLMNIGGN